MLINEGYTPRQPVLTRMVEMLDLTYGDAMQRSIEDRGHAATYMFTVRQDCLRLIEDLDFAIKVNEKLIADTQPAQMITQEMSDRLIAHAHEMIVLYKTDRDAAHAVISLIDTYAMALVGRPTYH